MGPKIKPNQDLLIVDDDEEFCDELAHYFSKLGYFVQAAYDAESALRELDRRAYAVAVIDMVMPGMSGIELLDQLKKGGGETEVILLTGEGTIERAVEAMRLGAFDFLTKPIRMAHLETVIQKAGTTGELRRENRQLRTLIKRSDPHHQMVGDSPAMTAVYRLIERAAPSDKPILIQGESGAGKELVAHAIHDASSRNDKPLVVINCAALPEQLLESELFGHEKGAFTGAMASKPGLIEVADGGTLFIDEIGELAISLQPKLLRVLEDGTLRRVGSLKERRVDVRIIAATNRELKCEIEEKRFREDLYYRINIITIQIPPLRNRGNDALQLLEHFTNPGWEIDDEFRNAITEYHWPGNVRQLINAVERAKILADDERLRKENLPPEVIGGTSLGIQVTYDADIDLAALTRARVVQALQQENGVKLRTAKALGISRSAMYRLIKKYRLTRDELGE